MTAYTNNLKRSNPAIGAMNWGPDWYINQIISDVVLKQLSQRNFVISGGVITDLDDLNISMGETEVNISGNYFLIAAMGLTALTAGAASAVETNYVFINDTGGITISTSPPETEDYCMIEEIDTNDTGIVRRRDLRQKKPLTQALQPLGGVDLQGGVTGLLMEQATDFDHDIKLNPGICYDSTGQFEISLETAITKQIDATWAEGTNLGGLIAGTYSMDTMYNFYAIRKSTGAVDAGFLETGLDIEDYLPSGYTKYRWMGWIVTADGSSNILSFKQTQDRMIYYEALNIASVPQSIERREWVDFSDKLPADYVVRARVAAWLLGSTVSPTISFSEAGFEATNVLEFGSGFPIWTGLTGDFVNINILDGGIYNWNNLASSETAELFAKEVEFIR